MGSPDLDFITTEQLCDELAKRHDSVLIVLDSNPTSNMYTTQCFWFGGVMKAMGLARYADKYVYDYLRSKEKPE